MLPLLPLLLLRGRMPFSPRAGTAFGAIPLLLTIPVGQLLWRHRHERLDVRIDASGTSCGGQLLGPSLMNEPRALTGLLCAEAGGLDGRLLCV